MASRGEARALAVSLRLAERRVVTEGAGSLPLLLLDDVAAELDRERTSRVVSMVSLPVISSTLTVTLPDGVPFHDRVMASLNGFG